MWRLWDLRHFRLRQRRDLCHFDMSYQNSISRIVNYSIRDPWMNLSLYILLDESLLYRHGEFQDDPSIGSLVAASADVLLLLLRCVHSGIRTPVSGMTAGDATITPHSQLE